MAQNVEHNPVSPESMQLGYEPQRMNIRALVWLLAFFAVGMIALQAFLVWMMRAIDARDERADVPRSALTVDQQPPPPILQSTIGHDATEYQDLERQRRQEDEIFSRLGWTVDQATHRVTLPPEIVGEVAERQRVRAAGPYVPPTTTGKDFNSIVPATIPAADRQPGIGGGGQP